MLNFCDFIQVYVFTTNHHLKRLNYLPHSIPSVALVRYGVSPANDLAIRECIIISPKVQGSVV